MFDPRALFEMCFAAIKMNETENLFGDPKLVVIFSKSECRTNKIHKKFSRSLQLCLGCVLFMTSLRFLKKTHPGNKQRHKLKLHFRAGRKTSDSFPFLTGFATLALLFPVNNGICHFTLQSSPLLQKRAAGRTNRNVHNIRSYFEI